MTVANINWYPGHMKKTRELIQANLKAVDLVIEVIDARIPISSRNPIIDELVQSKRRVIVLNKSDLADQQSNALWETFFKRNGSMVIQMNCNRGDGVKELLRMLERVEEDVNRERTLRKPLRMMIVGVPNVGKSSLINRLTGHKSAKTGDKPGITRGKQWLSVSNGMQLLDTPGILWPKFEDPNVGLNLAFCGSIKDEILDAADLTLELIKVLQRDYPALLKERYKLDELCEEGDYSEELEREASNEQEAALANMKRIAQKRGFVQQGKRIDYERTAKTVLDEFRQSLIGRITLEKP